MEPVVTSLPNSILTCSLKEQKNLNSFFAVMFGVSNTAVSRLARTWEVTNQLRAAACCPELCRDQRIRELL